MSVYTNQTNANASSIFPVLGGGGGGGGGSNYNILTANIVQNSNLPNNGVVLDSGYGTTFNTNAEYVFGYRNNDPILTSANRWELSLGDIYDTRMAYNTGIAGADVIIYNSNTNTFALPSVSTINGAVPALGKVPQVQAGQHVVSGTSDTVTLAVPFDNSNYCVVATPQNSAPTFSWSAIATGNDTFTIEANTSGLTFNWIATDYTQ